MLLGAVSSNATSNMLPELEQVHWKSCADTPEGEISVALTPSVLPVANLSNLSSVRSTTLRSEMEPESLIVNVDVTTLGFVFPAVTCVELVFIGQLLGGDV